MIYYYFKDLTPPNSSFVVVFPGSSGALCLTELETALEQKQGGEILVLSCKVIQRLQPLQHESNKEKVFLTIMFCYELYL